MGSELTVACSRSGVTHDPSGASHRSKFAAGGVGNRQWSDFSHRFAKPRDQHRFSCLLHALQDRQASSLELRNGDLFHSVEYSMVKDHGQTIRTSSPLLSDHRE
jgi:hypothetical protein